MKLMSKIMAIAMLSLVAGAASAATFSNDGPKSADGNAVLTVTLTGGGTGANYTLVAPAAVTITGGNPIASGGGAATLKSATAGTFTITYDNDTATDPGSFTVTFSPIATLEVDISVSVTVAVDLAFVDNLNNAVATPRSWDLTGSQLKQTYVSTGVFTSINNRTPADVSLSVQQITPALFKWTVGVPAAGPANKNFYQISTASTTPAASTTLTGAGVQAYIATFPAETISDNLLTFKTPFTVSYLDPRANPGDVIKVVYTATAIP